MIQRSSAEAYREIRKVLPEKTRPIYDCIFHNHGVCIGEIGKLLSTPERTMQNSTVSGRVNDLMKCGLVHYLEEKKISPISGLSVNMLVPNDVFTVTPEQVKLKLKEKVIYVDHGADEFKIQGSLL